MQNRDPKASQRVLFLCTGNYYRSRFAEIFFNWQAEQRGLGWTADSRGLALDELQQRRHFAAHARQPEVARHRSWMLVRLPLPVSEADLAAADRIIAVKEAEHRPMFEAKFPDVERPRRVSGTFTISTAQCPTLRFRTWNAKSLS